MTDDKALPLVAVTSAGLWKQRGDIETLLECRVVLWPLCAFTKVDAFAGWGGRSSGQRARWLAARHGVRAVTLEDGFLKSYAPGAAEPAHSFVIDRTGVYFDSMRPNDLDTLIETSRYSPAEVARASAAMASLRSHRLSKYNNSPLKTLDQSGLPSGRPFVLLIDQVAGDASIAAAGADEARFGQMLAHACRTYPGHVLAVRTHPAAMKTSPLLKAARALGVAVVATARMNPWPLLQAADAVYTVSSQLGFEALIAGAEVHCFGVTYYSHRGLTHDHVACSQARARVSLEHVFHAAYIDYSRYLDLHDRRPVAIETAMEQMLVVREQRSQIRQRVYTGGLSPWKRRAMDPFLKGPGGSAVHCANLKTAIAKAEAKGGQIALWGVSQQLPASVPAIRFEDGFIRSRGLGANLSLPCSLAMDGEHVYFDARGESRLEKIIATHPFPDALLQRARALTDLIVTSGVSKYNLDTLAKLPEVEPGRLRILAPGQVEKDASIRFGSPVVKSNRALVAEIRRLFPQAFIVYKQHPDVTAGIRSGGLAPVDADLVVSTGDIKDWIGWCDRVETMTSLAGFEALIRNKPVGVHGLPFYAGWGLTDDRVDISRRQRRIDIDMLVAATLILYPFYIHPVSAMPCTPEALVEEIARKRTIRLGVIAGLRMKVIQSINRTAVKIRDGHN